VDAPFAHSPEFQRLVAGAVDVQIARVALEFAADAYPGLDVEAYLARIERLAARVRDRFAAGAKARDILGQINWVLYVEEELRGNDEDYKDPRNSYLNEVLDRKLGIPISLSAVYWAVAEQVGLEMAGVNLPLHFMLRVEEGGQAWFVDAFNGGAVYNRENCQRVLSGIAGKAMELTEAETAACSPAAVVTRMLRNLKAVYGSKHDLASLLPVQRRLAALNPDLPDELRELAMVCVKTEHNGEAIDHLKSYLSLTPPPEYAEEMHALLDAVQRQLARWN
jgi:regulator of sirC expression with transglutaminase-like and TPR domain